MFYQCCSVLEGPLFPFLWPKHSSSCSIKQSPRALTSSHLKSTTSPSPLPSSLQSLLEPSVDYGLHFTESLQDADSGSSASSSSSECSFGSLRTPGPTSSSAHWDPLSSLEPFHSLPFLVPNTLRRRLRSKNSNVGVSDRKRVDSVTVRWWWRSMDVREP